MNKNLQLYRIPYGHDLWYKFRTVGLTEEEAKQFGQKAFAGGIGGSEAGVICGFDKQYDSPIWPYHLKIGDIDRKKEENVRMITGREIEDTVARFWSHWGGDEQSFIQNMSTATIIRKCRNLNAYVVNPKYPWLFASVDRLINAKGGINLITGEMLKTEAILECKAMGHFRYTSLENGVSKAHLAQIHVYMLIMETDYAEIAMLVDSGKFIVEPIQRDETFMKEVIDTTKSFWYDKVLPGRKAYEMKQKCLLMGDYQGSEANDAIIQQMEPEPDSSPAYREYLEERYQRNAETHEGSFEAFDWAKEDRFYLSLKNKIDEKQSLLRNRLIKEMSVNAVKRIDFGSSGSVACDKKFTNGLKEKPDDKFIQQEFNKLSWRY